MKKKERVKMGPWDIAAAVLASLLLVNFLGFLVICMSATGLIFDPVELMLTGTFLLLGLVFLPVANRKCRSKLCRRLLWAGVIGNGLAVAFICVAVVAILAAWQ